MQQWIATLHPENADVVIDNRFLIPGNPWWKIYEQCKNELPSAIAVPVEQVELAPANNQEQVPTHWLCLCSPIELVVTFTIMSVTFPVILVCEIVGLCFYLPAFVLYWMAKPLDPPNAFTGIFYSFLMVLYYTFMICDSACLLSSVCVAESFAIVCWLSSLLFGGIWTANNRHQYIRRNCHLTRWAFRAPISQPPRHLCTCFFRANEDVLFTNPTAATELNHQTEAKQDSATVVTHVQVDAFQ